jgi:L-seryl-tRNA(Ser) seleniumtransferase
MAVSGAVLREVGTTNITRLADYERALGPNTGALLQVHSSNYRIRGFTKAVPLADLVTLGKKHGVLVIDDVGSGALLDFNRFGLPGEPVARESVAAGADVVLFSGDKLLGGPQAGIIAGRKELIQRVEKDPLMRAFRLDKMTLAALEATLRLYLHEERALREVPVLRLLATPVDELRRRAEAAGFEKLCAFTHAPAYFIHMGFSIVPHVWLSEKILTDCRVCPEFRQCGQYAVIRTLARQRASASDGALHG